MRLALLEKLVNADGTSGNEAEVRNVLKNELAGLLNDLRVDPIGNLIGTRRSAQPSSPTIMLAAHMDEVGLIVKRIRPDGYLVFDTSGFVDPSILPSQWVRIRTRTGTVHGVVGVRPGHQRQAEMPRTSHRSMWIDVGAKSEEEVRQLGIMVGDFATYDRQFRVSANGGYVFGKALDNRVGCAVLVDSIAKIVSAGYPCNISAVGTVMEEIGAQGARVAANNLKPDIAIVLDGLPSSDPSLPLELSAVEVGKGAVIRRAEISAPNCNVTPRWLSDLAVRTAEEEGIPYQVDILSFSFSDASAINISAQGIPTIAILVPRRNSHSPAEVASLGDIDHTIRLTASLVEKLSTLGPSLLKQE